MLLQTRTLSFLALFLLTGCFSYEPVELQEVNYVEITKISSDSVSVEITVRISNPNSYNITLTDPDVDLSINDDLVGKAIFKRDLVLEKNSSSDYTIPVSAALNRQLNTLIIASLGGLFGGNVKVGAKGKVVGKAGLIRRRVPFEFEEDLSGQLNP
jgi:LEA14-like dessication related protein